MASFDTVAELFAIATHEMRWGAAPPTDKSIDRINQLLEVRIPHTYRRIASVCPNYGAYLNGIGEDFDHGIHILRLNKLFHELQKTPEDYPPLPTKFVMITHGEDGEAFCWDIGEQTSFGEHPILHIGLESARADIPAHVRIDNIRFESFHAFLEDIALYYARCGFRPGFDPRLATRAVELVREISKGRKSDT